MSHVEEKTRGHIRKLNDAFRRSFDPNLGRIMLTVVVNALPSDVCAMAIHKTATFDTFTLDNDPHGEHDFAAFDIGAETFFWKINYYDRKLEFGSEDPADSTKTTRVLTLMLA